MISLLKVQEIERLLAAGGLSQRKIAKRTGVSRATISGIASGARPDYEALRRARVQTQEEPEGPLVRCPGCGGRVYAPCRLCRVRGLISAKTTQLRLMRDAEDRLSPPALPAVARRAPCSVDQEQEPRLAG